jgi:phenol 2-monooxygenase
VEEVLTLLTADIRVSCSIHSTKTGSTMTFPREDRLVRFYVQLAETGSEGDDFDTSKVTPEMIAEKASQILNPYKLSYEHCDWWSVYTVGQQCAPRFSRDNRVFLVGDAVHTHSPTMGAGMNVSMQDSYNLVWKLGQVIKGVAKPDILDTYNDERQSVAQHLIEMDREMCEFYEKGAESDAHNYDEFYERFRTFLSGVGVEYGPNALVVPKREDDSLDSEACSDLDSSKDPQRHARRSLASRISLGQRLPSFLVLNHAEANIVHVHSMLPADGRWRLLVLAGDISKPTQMARLKTLCERLDAASSILRTYTPEGDKADAVIEVLTIHAAPRRKVELFSLPELLRPFDPKLGYDYWKCYVNNNAGEEGDFDDAYAKWGVDKDEGCLVVIRPDQHVSLVCRLQDVEEVEQFFSTILVPHKQS